MLLTLLGMVMPVSLGQPEKASFPMLVTLLGKVTLARLEQPLKAHSPILVTPTGMVIPVMPELVNALTARAVTGRLLYAAGITTAPVVTVPLATLYSLLLLIRTYSSPAVPAGAGVALADAPFVHVVPALGLVYVPAPPPAARYLSLISPCPLKALAGKPLDGIEPAKVTLASWTQPLKAEDPILVTLPGIVMLVRWSQSLKACFPISVTPLGIVILERLTQRTKALSPILVTPLGIVTLVMLLFFLKESSSTSTTGKFFIFAGMFTVVALPL